MKISKLENSKATPGTDEFGNFYSKRGGNLLGSKCYLVGYATGLFEPCMDME